MTLQTDVPGLGQGRGCRADAAPSPAELFAAHHERLLRLGVLLTGDEDAAERLVESAFRSVARRRRAPDPAEALAQLCAALVAGARSPRSRAAPPGSPSDTTPAQDSGRLPPDHAAVLTTLGRLPPHQREVLVLHYWGGLTEVEVGEVLRLEPEEVCSLAHRALTTLTGDLGDPGPVTTEERVTAALQARADRVPRRPVPPPAAAVGAPRPTVPRAAARWLPVGSTAVLVCAVMAAVAAFSVGGPVHSPDRPHRTDPPYDVIRRVGTELALVDDRLRFPVAKPVSAVVRQPMPAGGGSCYAFDYPMQADGRVDPSVEMYAAGGCRGGLVVAPVIATAAERVRPAAGTRAHVRLGTCAASERGLVVTAGGLTADHTVFDCTIGPVDEWVFRDDVVWSLDGGSRMAALVGQAGPAAGTVGAGG